MEQYSVLMSVYFKENPEYLKQSIQSMLNQTWPTNDFVLVCDGPLTAELDAVIEQFDGGNPGLFQIVRLEKNLGIGGAATEGLKRCGNDLVAKMDSDDISNKNRCHLQIKCFERDPTLSIVGGQLEEFQGDITHIVAVRNVPLLHDDIYQYAKKRMPFNNQTIMYRKSFVEQVGGYHNLKRCEDYDLYVRMLHSGAKAQNSDQILTSFRLNEGAYRRRGMWSNVQGFIAVKWNMYLIGFCSIFDFLISCCGQVVVSLLPTRAKRFIYERFLRG